MVRRLPAPPDVLEQHFHALLRERTGRCFEEIEHLLPPLSPLTEGPAVQIVFRVVGMMGGFTYRLGEDVLEVHHQLAWSPKGLLRVRSDRGVWLLPPSLALWIPAALPHATESAGDAVMRSAYVAPACCPHIDWPEPTVLAVTPLPRALIDHLARTDLAAGARTRAEAVLLDELHPVPVTSVSAPAPRDPRARTVAERLTADPADGRTLASWGTEAGTSARTLARLFVAETGLAFGQWRERLRMQAAMPHLAAGLPIEAVARRVGYATASSFTAAFHRLVGVTPRQYFPLDDRGTS